MATHLQLCGHLLDGLDRGLELEGGQTELLAGVGDAQAVNGLALALRQPPLHLRHQVLEPLVADIHQLQLHATG